MKKSPKAGVEFSLVMPCLNESQTLKTCNLKARSSIDLLGLAGEIIEADNGSRGGSRQIALNLGIRVIGS